MLFGDPALGDLSWTSRGLAAGEAIQRFRSWANEAIASMEIEVADDAGFAANWKSRAVGPLHVVMLEATPQRVIHQSYERRRVPGATFQLIHCLKTPIRARASAEEFRLDEGEFMLIDNGQFFELSMDARHKAIVLVMPGEWLERFLPDPLQVVGRPFAGGARWGAPLGAFLRIMADDIEGAALPRSVIADQVGPLLALAVGHQPAAASPHKAKLAQRAQRLIAERHADARLDPAEIAGALGISKRYLHAVLAEAGATFTGALAAARLDHAGELLADRRFDRHQITEIAWRCGYLDPSYFSRVFRRRFAKGPREWRAERRG